MRVRRAAALLLGLLALPATAGAADVTVSADPTATDVGGFGDWVVWSRRSAPGEYRLVQRRDGVVSDALVPSFRHPVDADVGPGRDGGTVAVYARCPTSRTCDVFQLDLAAGTERKVSAVSSEARAELAPSAWRGRYAFTRAVQFAANEREFEGAGIEGYDTGGVLTTGPRRRISAAEAFDTDVRGSRVVFRSGAATVDGPTTIRIRSLVSGARTCVVVQGEAEGGLGDDDEVVTSPVLAGEYVYWAHLVSPGRFSTGSGDTTIRRLRVPGTRCQLRGPEEVSRPIVAAPDVFSSIAAAGGRFYYTTKQGVMEASDPLRFASR